MHILIIPSDYYIPEYSPFSSIFQHHQAHALKEAGYQVGVITPEIRSLRLLKRKLFGWSKGIKFDSDGDIPVIRSYGWAFFSKFPDIAIKQWLSTGLNLWEKYISKYGFPDLIHAHNALYAGILASEIKEKYNIPYLVTEHSSAYPRGLIRKKEIPYIKKVFKYSNKNISVSPFLTEVIEKVIGISSISFDYVPNILGQDFENKNTRQYRKTIEKDFCFLNVGSLIELKGQTDLLYAFANAFQYNEQIKLKIVGNGPLKKRLESLSEELQINNQVYFIDSLNRKDLLAEMQKCDIYIHSSHFETFGVALIEALSCGKPIISTSCGGPEYIINDKNGILVPVKDIKSLSLAMKEMYESISNYSYSEIREDCINRFGKEQIIKKLSYIYEQILIRKILN